MFSDDIYTNNELINLLQKRNYVVMYDMLQKILELRK